MAITGQYAHGQSSRELVPGLVPTNALVAVASEKPTSEDSVRLSFEWPGASRSVEFLGESDEKPFRPADVAEPIRILIPDYFAYELCAALAKPAKCFVDIFNGEHDAEVA